MFSFIAISFIVVSASPEGCLTGMFLKHAGIVIDMPGNRQLASRCVGHELRSILARLSLILSEATWRTRLLMTLHRNVQSLQHIFLLTTYFQKKKTLDHRHLRTTCQSQNLCYSLLGCRHKGTTGITSGERGDLVRER